MNVEVAAYAAAIHALADRGELAHVQVLTGALLAVLERVGVGDVTSRDGGTGTPKTPCLLQEHPENAVSAMDPPPPPAKSAPLTPAQRQANRRARLKLEARHVSGQQLALGPVTRRHAPVVTSVTSSVTRDVTSSSDLLSPERLPRSLSGERESSPESCTTVTRDAVTSVTLPEVLDGTLRTIFLEELAGRPGIELDADALWRKFRSKKPPTMELVELRSVWRSWCRKEWPTRETSARQLPLSPPRREVTKEEPVTPPASGPSVRAAPVDAEELSRRVEVEGRERRARERKAMERDMEATGIRELVAAQLEDTFSPEAMAAARAAALGARKAS